MESDKIRCAAIVENLALVTGFAESCADRFGLEARKKFGLLIALEEAFINTCCYAYPEGEGEVELCCSPDGALFVLEIADQGKPFDVLSLPNPDTTMGIMDREIGGLGVHCMRKLSDEVSYRRENGRNVLRLLFKRTKDGLP